MLFTTPGLLFSGLFSLVFIFTSNQKRGSKFTGQLPPFPRLGRVVIGEFHHPRKPVAAEFPTWLTIPDRGLFTGCAVFGAIGSEKLPAVCGRSPNKFSSIGPTIHTGALGAWSWK